jgi:DUF4097 and DUF4098 domain-containing protein YvlB
MRMIGFLGLAALTAGTAALRSASAQGERYQLAGERVAVYNLAGRVTVAAGSGSAVIVEVTRGGADAGELTVERGELGGTDALRVIYPGDRIVYPSEGYGRTELRVREDGTFGDGGDWPRDRGRRVVVARSGEGLEAYADLTIRVPAGRRVVVHLAVGDLSAANVSGDLVLDTHSADVTASSIRGDLLVDVGSGNVRVNDVEGDVTLDTGSGNVDASNVRGATILLDTGSGNVVARDVTATSLTVDTGSGDVDVSAATAETVLIDTGSGEVDLALTGNPREIMIDTGSGSVTVRVPGDFGAELEIETGSGEIEVGFPFQTHRFSRTHLQGTVGDGRAQVTVDTGSGDIRILRATGI